MFTDGIKVFIVFIVYSIPAILIVAYTALSLYPILGSLITNPSSMNINVILSILSAFILVLVAGLYMLIILPVNYIAVAHMANNNSKISFAFRFHEIINKMSNIGWGNILIWYLAIGTIVYIDKYHWLCNNRYFLVNNPIFRCFTDIVNHIPLPTECT